jgi:signal peptidase II
LKIIFRALLFLAALAGDRATKIWALSSLGPALSNGGPFFGIALHLNPGLSFSLLAKAPEAASIMAAGALILFGYLCFRFRRLASSPGTALLWAGALGNLIDRLLYGHVVDWICLFNGYINLADIWLCLGALWVVFRERDT